jgi:type IV pilus assembly protein PilA
MKRKGFTLIELMIVVAIIGILAAIAIPNFLRFQARAKQSEAKQNLGAIFTAYTSYFSDNNTFPSSNAIVLGTVTYNCLAVADWEPKGTIRYNYDCVNTEAFSPPINNSTCTPPVVTAGTQIDFTVAACGNVDSDTIVDEWTIDTAKKLKNVQDDVKL